jgi:hypothetical protein
MTSKYIKKNMRFGCPTYAMLVSYFRRESYRMLTRKGVGYMPTLSECTFALPNWEVGESLFNIHNVVHKKRMSVP